VLVTLYSNSYLVVSSDGGTVWTEIARPWGTSTAIKGPFFRDGLCFFTRYEYNAGAMYGTMDGSAFQQMAGSWNANYYPKDAFLLQDANGVATGWAFTGANQTYPAEVRYNQTPDLPSSTTVTVTPSQAIMGANIYPVAACLNGRMFMVSGGTLIITDDVKTGTTWRLQARTSRFVKRVSGSKFIVALMYANNSKQAQDYVSFCVCDEGRGEIQLFARSATPLTYFRISGAFLSSDGSTVHIVFDAGSSTYYLYLYALSLESGEFTAVWSTSTGNIFRGGIGQTDRAGLIVGRSNADTTSCVRRFNLLTGAYIGDGWNQLSAGESAPSIYGSFVTPSYVYAVLRTGSSPYVWKLCISADDGETWTKITLDSAVIGTSGCTPFAIGSTVGVINVNGDVFASPVGDWTALTKVFGGLGNPSNSYTGRVMLLEDGVLLVASTTGYFATVDGLSWYSLGAITETSVELQASVAVLDKRFVCSDGVVTIEKGPEYDDEIYFKVPAIASQKDGVNYYVKARS